MIKIDKNGNVQESLLPSPLEGIVDEKGETIGMVVNGEVVGVGEPVDCGPFRMVLLPMDYSVNRGNKKSSHA